MLDILRFRLIARWSWALAILVFLVELSIAVYFNREWFSFSRHALSDLGGPNANYPSIFNVSLIVVAVILATYSFYLLERFGIMQGGLMAITSILLACVGLFPEGTSLHSPFSVSFFLVAFMAIASIGLRLYREDRRREALIIATTIALAILGLLIIPWPSIALLELYLIALLSVSIAVSSIS